MSQLDDEYYIIVKETKFAKEYLNEYISSNQDMYPCTKLPRTTCLFRSAQPLSLNEGLILTKMLNSKYNIGTDPNNVEYNHRIFWSLVKIEITKTVIIGNVR